MKIGKVPRRYRFPVSVINRVVWLHFRYNISYRDIQEHMNFRGIFLSHETIKCWCYKFSSNFKDAINVIRIKKPNDKWHIEEMPIKINGKVGILWQAVDSDGYELEVLFQEKRCKKEAVSFLTSSHEFYTKINKVPRRYRFPVSIINRVVWLYLRYNISYRDIREHMNFRGIFLSHETIRCWCYKFSSNFKDVINVTRIKKPNDKWHIEETSIKINGKIGILWQVVDSDGYELEMLFQEKCCKKGAVSFLTSSHGDCPVPQVIVADQLVSKQKPIRHIYPKTAQLSHR